MKQNGFTLIELIVVIVILGILAVTAAPRFLNVSTDSHIAVVKSTGASFKTGVDLAYSKNLTSNGGGASTNVPIYDDSATGQLDFNEWGYPAQQWHLPEESPRLNNAEDCISVWGALLLDPPSVSSFNSPEETNYIAEYIQTDQCTYHYRVVPGLSINYNSMNGEVIVDEKPVN
ncbi:type II secretion system protein [Vibrio sp. J383]|uniref:type II secretion system protein n=1 Tax=Vibrio sp. J383 TaxID=2942997 RepID=UPI0020BFFAF0|nr:prepilin-type N-terminal cleavage/methylation domain-containing protein [Vibrio sp. J383]UQV24838.1 prepilin-type N-terminal cleavage/methylation domain-containing protein [Vibrio sp. J383]